MAQPSTMPVSIVPFAFGAIALGSAASLRPATIDAFVFSAASAPTPTPTATPKLFTFGAVAPSLAIDRTALITFDAAAAGAAAQPQPSTGTFEVAAVPPTPAPTWVGPHQHWASKPSACCPSSGVPAVGIPFEHTKNWRTWEQYNDGSLVRRWFVLGRINEPRCHAYSSEKPRFSAFRDRKSGISAR